ncbi:MAG: hypothetical protein JXB06_13745 [Spirochaetales bacterium]|nr:hypothetical protein [Spirochaetales bacterium]
MKRIVLLVMVLALVPLLSFADVGVGAAAFFNSPVLIGQDVDVHELWDGGFTFGGDFRWKLLKILQLEALALVTLDETNAVGLYPNAGLAFDLAILRLSAGIGPNLVFFLDDVGDPAMFGFHGKANADILLGPVSVGLSYMMALNLDGGIELNRSTGMLGASVLFWF